MYYDMYIDEETKRQLNSYKLQIAVSFFVILAVLIAITITKDLYFQTLYRNSNNQKINNSIAKRSKIVVTMYLLVALYFVYLAFTNYKKNKNNTNFWFLISAELALIATFIRYIKVINNQESNLNLDDLI